MLLFAAGQKSEVWKPSKKQRCSEMGAPDGEVHVLSILLVFKKLISFEGVTVTAVRVAVACTVGLVSAEAVG